MRRLERLHQPGLILASIVVLLLPVVAMQFAPVFAQRKTDEQPHQSELDRQDLLRKKRRFDLMEVKEQESLREFHRELTADPDKEKLTRVMKAYEEWLKGRRPGERAELLSLPPDERIQRMRKLMKDEADERLKRYARSSLTGKDADVVNEWSKQVIKRRAEDSEARLTEKDRAEIGSSDIRKAFRLRMMWMQMPATEMGLTEKEISELKANLSQTANAVIDKEPDSLKRDQMVRELIYAADFSRRSSRFGGFEVPEEELWKLYSGLDSKTREYLDKLSSGRMRGELYRLYYVRRRSASGGRQNGGRSNGGRSRGGSRSGNGSSSGRPGE